MLISRRKIRRDSRPITTPTKSLCCRSRAASAGVCSSRRWHCRNRTQTFTPTGYVPRPLFELELKQGDLLYLPRGYVHAAHTSQVHSAHVTIGISVYTWVELLSELIARSKDFYQ